MTYITILGFILFILFFLYTYVTEVIPEYSRLHVVDFAKSFIYIEPGDISRLFELDQPSRALLSEINNAPGKILFNAFGNAFGNQNIRFRS